VSGGSGGGLAKRVRGGGSVKGWGGKAAGGRFQSAPDMFSLYNTLLFITTRYVFLGDTKMHVDHTPAENTFGGRGSELKGRAGFSMLKKYLIKKR